MDAFFLCVSSFTTDLSILFLFDNQVTIRLLTKNAKTKGSGSAVIGISIT